MNYNKDKIEFITVSGWYTTEPICYQHCWNQSNSVGEASNTLRKAWKHFKDNNQLIPNAKGVIKEPSFRPSILVTKAKDFRRHDVYMKDLPKGFSGKYDWKEIAAASLQYKPNKSRFKF
jgi:hypothetical protein